MCSCVLQQLRFQNLKVVETTLVPTFQVAVLCFSVYSDFSSNMRGRRYRCPFCKLGTQAIPRESFGMSLPLLAWDMAASFLVSWNWELRVIFCFFDLMSPNISKPKTSLGNHRFIRSLPMLKFCNGTTFCTLWGNNFCYPEDSCLLILPSNKRVCRDFFLYFL